MVLVLVLQGSLPRCSFFVSSSSVTVRMPMFVYQLSQPTTCVSSVFNIPVKSYMPLVSKQNKSINSKDLFVSLLFVPLVPPRGALQSMFTSRHWQLGAVPFSKPLPYPPHRPSTWMNTMITVVIPLDRNEFCTLASCGRPNESIVCDNK